MIHMSAKEYQAILKQRATQKPRKYRNKHVFVYKDGYVSEIKDLPNHGGVIEKYDSAKEYQRGCELNLLERAGKIHNLRKQVPLLVHEAPSEPSGDRRAPIWYKADYVYTEAGKTIVEDVKGIDRKTGKPKTTEAFRLKWKILQSKYTDFEFRIY